MVGDMEEDTEFRGVHDGEGLGILGVLRKLHLLKVHKAFQER